MSVQTRLLSIDADPMGSQFQVNSYTTHYQYFPEIGSDGGNGFVVAWESQGSNGTDTSVSSIQAQRYAWPVFVDGFESGDTSAWSAVFP